MHMLYIHYMCTIHCMCTNLILYTIHYTLTIIIYMLYTLHTLYSILYTQLDMEAVVWLEDYLSKWDKILFLVSHSQDFMNNVCTHIVHLTKKKLAYYSGIYTLYIHYIYTSWYSIGLGLV